MQLYTTRVNRNLFSVQMAYFNISTVSFIPVYIINSEHPRPCSITLHVYLTTVYPTLSYVVICYAFANISQRLPSYSACLLFATFPVRPTFTAAAFLLSIPSIRCFMLRRSLLPLIGSTFVSISK